VVFRVRCGLKLTLLDAPDIQLFAQTNNAVTACDKALSSQFYLKPPGAVALAGLLVRSFDGNLQALILLGST